MRRRQRAAGCGVFLAAVCAACGAPQEGTPGVAHYDRPPGMPIGTGATGGELEEPAAAEVNGDLAIPRYEVPAASEPPSAPCTFTRPPAAS